MSDLNSPKESPSNLSIKSDGENFAKASARKLPRICLHAKVCSRTVGKYAPDDAARLDAVLAGVNQLIKRLDIEFGDDCCGPDHGVVMETKQGSNTKSLITGFKGQSPLTSVPFGREDNMTGASKQEKPICADSTRRKKDSATTNRNDINKVKTPAEENNNFIKSDATFEKENNSDFIVEEAGMKFETNTSKKNNEKRSQASLSKQMTTTFIELKSHPATHKKLSFPIVESFQLTQHLSEERLYNTLDEAVCLTDVNQRQKSFGSSKDEFCEAKTNDHETVFKAHIAESPLTGFVTAPLKNNIFTTENSGVQSTPFAEIQNEFSSNKDKKKRKTEIFSKVSSYKETNTRPVEAVSPKRKISKCKEPDELKKLNKKDSNILRFSFQKCDSRKTNFPSELRSSDTASICNDKLPDQEGKPSSKRKTFLLKQKKFGLNFRRSQSLEAKPLLQCENKNQSKENPIKLKVKTNFAVPLPSTAPVWTGTTRNSEQEPMRFFTNKSSPTNQERTACFEICSDFHISMKADTQSIADPIEEAETNEFHNYYRKTGRQRSASDFITKGPGSKPTKASLMHNNHHTAEYLSLSQSRHELAEPRNSQSTELYSSVHAWPQIDSDGSLRSSQDSLEDHNYSSRCNNDSKQSILGRQYENLNEQNGLESVANLANKIGKKKKLRKTLKKARTVSIHDADEMAERTWSPTGNGTWSNLNGKTVELDNVRLQVLSELESDALQKVALDRLHEAEINVAIVVPKDESKTSHRKLSIKKKYGVHLSSKDKNKDKNQSDHVFGIPLVNVVENDQLLRLQKSASFAMSTELYSSEVANESVSTINDTGKGSSLSSSSDSCSGSSSSIHNQLTPSYNYPDDDEDVSTQRFVLKRSSSDNPSSDCEVFSNATNTENSSQNQPQTPNSAKLNPCTASQPLRRRGAIAADSINEIDPYQSQLLEALSLTVSGTTTNQRKEKKRSLLPPTMPSVPYVVQKCCDHIKKYGLDVTGIFRIAGSKKRVKQLREEFDRGMDVTIDEDYNPHDVAALLKEFFRDLPEALFTRELYPAFIQTAKLSKQERLSCLRYLIWLLPHSNRDTLYTLLNFLAVVAAHSENSVDQAGNKVPGNKMNGANLAMIFGPNVMHRYKKSSQSGNDNHYQVQNLEKPEESTAVIKIVTDLIADQVQLFQVPKEEHDETLHVLKETDPEAVDFLLRRKAANQMREKIRSHSSPTPLKSPKGEERQELVDDGIEIVSEFQKPFHESKIEKKETRISNNYVFNSGPQSGQYPGVRSSYRQATCPGDAAIKSASYNANTKLKFKRPAFENTQDPFHLTSENSDIYQLENSNNSGLEEHVDDAANVIERSKHVDGSTQSSIESTASISVITQDQSVSFTDDDILQIIGHKDEEDEEMRSRSVVPMIQEFRCTDECCDNTKKKATFQQATEVVGEEFECAHCQTNEPYFMKTQFTRAGSSSDSGILVDFVSNNVISPKMLNFHDHFCVQKQTEQIWKMRTDDFTPPSNVHEKTQQQCNEIQKSVIPEELLSSREEVDIPNYPMKKNEYSLSSNHLDERAISNLTNERNKRCSPGEHVQLKTASANTNGDNIHLDCQEDVNNQSLQLHPLTISAINAVLSPSNEQSLDSNQRPWPSVRKHVADTDQKTSAEFRPTPLPRKKLQQTLSQQHTQRQSGPPESPNSRQGRNPEEKMKAQDGIKAASPKLVQAQPVNNRNAMFSKPTVCVKGNKSHSATKSSQQASHNVAALARRFSKEDLALPTSMKVTSGSGWTSTGLIGHSNSNHCGFRQNSHRNGSTKEHKLVTSTTTSGHLSWHLTGRDSKHSQETLV